MVVFRAALHTTLDLLVVARLVIGLLEYDQSQAKARHEFGATVFEIMVMRSVIGPIVLASLKVAERFRQ